MSKTERISIMTKYEEAHQTEAIIYLITKSKAERFEVNSTTGYDMFRGYSCDYVIIYGTIPEDAMQLIFKPMVVSLNGKILVSTKPLNISGEK